MHPLCSRACKHVREKPYGEYLQLIQGRDRRIWYTPHDDASRAMCTRWRRPVYAGRTTRKDAAGAIPFRRRNGDPVRARCYPDPRRGNGYINEYPTGRLLRDAKLYEIGGRDQRNPPLADRSGMFGRERVGSTADSVLIRVIPAQAGIQRS